MLIDSNILVYALNSSSPKCQIAQKFLSSQSSSLFLTQQNVLECLRILTHKKFPQALAVKEAIVAVSAISNQATILFPTADTLAISLELIQKYQISGSEIFDAYLVATAMSHSVTTVATDNTKHLRKYVEIEVINPFR